MSLTILYRDADIVVAIKPVSANSEDIDGNRGCMPALLRWHFAQETLAQNSTQTHDANGDAVGGDATQNSVADCDTFLAVHRLDTMVSGVMVYARNTRAAAQLSKQIQAHALHKEYRAVVQGTIEPAQATLTDWLYLDKKRAKSFVVNKERKGVKQAILHYETLAQTSFLPTQPLCAQGQVAKNQAVSLLKIQLETGRTHQIRVQFASRKHPLLGDAGYGSHIKGCTIALFSHALTFAHPTTGEQMAFSAQPPEQFPWNLF